MAAQPFDNNKQENNMKKMLYTAIALVMGLFASCSKSETGEETLQFKQTTLQVVAEGDVSTRAAASGVDRFAIEVYSDATYTTAANVFEGETNKASNANGTFSMILDRTQKYYCLLWADKNGSSAYDLTSLKAVTLTGKAAEAWHGTQEIEAGTTAALTATLTRAVSKISLMETGALKAGGSLTLNFSQPTKFNVVDGITSVTSTRPEETITIASDVNGSATTPVKLNNTEIYVLSSASTADLTDLNFKYGTEDAFTVSNAPLKANYNTNIKGHYTSMKLSTFTVTCDDEWTTPDKDKTFPEVTSYVVGDVYPKTGKAVGVVFWIDPTDATKGKIVSLDEITNTKWSTVTNVAAGATTDARRMSRAKLT